MFVARTFSEIHFDLPAVVSIGAFDGVHRGHRFLLEQAKERSSEHGSGLVIVSFDPCPAILLRPGIGRYQLSSARQKLRLLDGLEPALVALLEFTTDLSQMTADEFMDALEERLRIKELWFGEDFRFGRDRGGDLPYLIERGRYSAFSLHMVSRRADDKDMISSSRIRKTVAVGDVAGAIPLLGRPLDRECADPATGTWLDGESPCALVPVEAHLILPADGIYAVLGPGGRPMVAAVIAAHADYPLLLKTASLERNASVEFIDRLCSLDEYRRHPFLWDTRAYARLDQWQRLSYEATGRN